MSSGEHGIRLRMVVIGRWQSVQSALEALDADPAVDVLGDSRCRDNTATLASEQRLMAPL